MTKFAIVMAILVAVPQAATAQGILVTLEDNGLRLNATRPSLGAATTSDQDVFLLVDMNGGDLLTKDPVVLQSPARRQLLTADASEGKAPDFAFAWAGRPVTYLIHRTDGGSGVIKSGDSVQFSSGSACLELSNGQPVMALGCGRAWTLKAAAIPPARSVLWPPTLTPVDNKDGDASAVAGVAVDAGEKALLLIWEGGVLLEQIPVVTGHQVVELTVPLSAGAHDLTASLVADFDGLWSDVSPPVRIEVVPTPRAPVFNYPAAATPMNGPVLSVRGTCEAAELVEVREKNVLLGTSTVVNGAFDVALSPALTKAGYHLLAAVAVRVVGGVRYESARAPLSVILKASSVSPPTFTMPNPYEPANAFVGNLPIAGHSERGTKTTVFLDGNELPVIQHPDGDWSALAQGVTAGNHLLKASASNGAMVSANVEAPVYVSDYPTSDSPISLSAQGSLYLKAPGAVLMQLAGWEESVWHYRVMAKPPQAYPPADTVMMVRELYDVRRERPYGTAAAMEAFTPGSEDMQERTLSVRYLGMDEQGRIPHRTTSLLRSARVETGYVVKKVDLPGVPVPQANCVAVAATPWLSFAVRTARLDRQDPNGTDLYYCSADVGGPAYMGMHLITVGEPDAPEGFISKGRRATEELTAFLQANVDPEEDRSFALVSGTVTQGLDVSDLPGWLASYGPLADLRKIREEGLFATKDRCLTLPAEQRCIMDPAFCAMPTECVLDHTFLGVSPGERCDLACPGTVNTPLGPIPDVTSCQSVNCQPLPAPGLWEVECPTTRAPSCSLACFPMPEQRDCTAKNPVAVNYRPEFFADAPEGRAQLEFLAQRYEKMMWRHIVDGQYVRLEFDPRPRNPNESPVDADGFPVNIIGHHNHRNATGDTARVVVALASKIRAVEDATGGRAEEDRRNLARLVMYLHATMTMANEPIPGDPLAPPPESFVIDPEKTRVRLDVCAPGPLTLEPSFDPAHPNFCFAGELSDADRHPPERNYRVMDAAPCGMERRPKGVWLRAIASGWNDYDMRPEQTRRFRQGPDGFDRVLNGDTVVGLDGVEHQRFVMYGFQGSPPGLMPPQYSRWDDSVYANGTKQWRMLTANSRDNVGMTMWALAHAYDLLEVAQAPNGNMVDLRLAVRLAVFDFARTLIANEYRLFDIDGRPPPFGRLVPPPPWEIPPQFDGGDPTNGFELLAWLKVCAHMDAAGATPCATEYASQYAKLVGRVAPCNPLFCGDPPLPWFSGVREYVHAANSFEQGRSLLVVQAIDTLVTLETDADRAAEYLNFIEDIVYPVQSFYRSPLMDTIYLRAKTLVGRLQASGHPVGIVASEDSAPADFEPTDGQSTRARVAGVLGQFPDPANAYVTSSAGSGPPTCKSISAVTSLCAPGVQSCLDLSQRDYGGCGVMENVFTRLVYPDSPSAPGVWALGLDKAFTHDSHVKPSYYLLKDEAACDQGNSGGVYEPLAFSYLLPYWLGRASGVLGAPQ